MEKNPARLICITIITISLIILSAGCLEPEGDYSSQPTTKEQPYVTDTLGRNITIPPHPERIVSMSPSNTEMLFALGLEDKIIGVSDYCTYPAEALNKTKIGGFSTPNIEKIASLNPDIVFGSAGVQEDTIRELGQLNITVVALEAKNLSQVLENIRTAGTATSSLDASEKLVSQMQRRIDNITRKTDNLKDDNRPWVYYEVWSDPLMTAGPGTLADDLIRLAGGRSIAYDAQTKYPIYNLEVLVKRNPAVIIVCGGHGSSTSGVEELMNRSGWQSIDAVRNHRVYSMDCDLSDRGGPRIVSGLETIAEYVHPELFQEAGK